MILALSTSHDECQVTLFDLEGTPLIGFSENGRHSEHLAVMVEKVFQEADKKNLTAVGINGGPGSFTGLRIGTSFAKGLCSALEIPLIASSGFEILRHQVTGHEDMSIMCVIHARKDEYFTRLNEETPEVRTRDQINGWKEKVKGKVLVKKQDIDQDLSYDFTADISSDKMFAPLIRKHKKGQIANLLEYTPLYMRPVNITKRRKPII